MIQHRHVPRQASITAGPFPDVRHLVVTRQGQPVDHWISYDLDAGCVRRHPCAPGGGPLLRGNGTGLVEEVAHGAFEVRWDTPGATKAFNGPSFPGIADA